jgi:hypothetical protein
LSRIEKIHLQEFPIPPPNILALEKKSRKARKSCYYNFDIKSTFIYEHLQEFSIKLPNLGFLARIEKIHLQVPPPNILALGKTITQSAQVSLLQL